MNITDKKLIKNSLDSLNKALTNKNSVKQLLNTDSNETKKLLKSLDDNFLSIEKGLNYKLVQPLKDSIDKIKDDFDGIKGDISDDLKRRIKETNSSINELKVLQKVKDYQKQNAELTKKIRSHFDIQKIFGFKKNEQEEDERILREEQKNEILLGIENGISSIPGLLKELPEKIGISTGKGLFTDIGKTIKNIFTGKGLLGGLAHWGTAIFGGLEMGDYLAKQGIDLSKLENLPLALNKGFSHLISKATLGILKEKEVETFFTNIGNGIVDSIKAFVGEDTFEKIKTFTSFAQDLWKKFYIGFTAFARWAGAGFTGGSYNDYINEVKEELSGNYSKRIQYQQELIKNKKNEINSYTDIADFSHGKLMVDNYIKNQEKTLTSLFDIDSFEQLENELQKAIDDPHSKLNKIQGYDSDMLKSSLKYVQGIRRYQFDKNMDDSGLSRSQMMIINEKYADTLIEKKEKAKKLLEKKEQELKELEQQLVDLENEQKNKKQEITNVHQHPAPRGITNNSDMLEQIAVEAEKQAKTLNTVGNCFTGTNNVLRKFGFHNKYGDVNTILPEMLKNKDFKVIPLNSKEDFYNLPRGTVVLSSASDINPHGHGYTILGNGLEASDHTQKITAGRNKKGAYGQSYGFIYVGNNSEFSQSNITDSAVNMNVKKQAEMQAKNNSNVVTQPVINNFNTSNNVNSNSNVDNNTSNGMTQMLALTQKWFMSGVGGNF